MTGELGIDDSDRVAFACAALSEAGLRTMDGEEPVPVAECVVKCGAIDAIEIIAVIESFYEVEFTQDDFDALFDLAKRGTISVGEMSVWLGDCEERRRSR